MTKLVAWLALLVALCPIGLAQELQNYQDPVGFPAAWPVSWKEYTVNGTALYDQTKSQDLTTGGTTPTGTVDIVGIGEAAAWWASNGDVLFIRYRLDGPPLALTGSSQPYLSFTWNLLIDTDGDGFKEFSLMIEGMNIQGELAPDDILVLYNDDPVQTVDRTRDVVWRQDSGLNASDRSLATANGEPGDSANWDSNPSLFVWDFGYTRVTQIDNGVAPGSNKSRYYLDVQVPIAALDATAVGGRKLTAGSIVRFAMSTANSNTNPAQKDFAYLGAYQYGGPDFPLPPGDPIDLGGGGPYYRPIITSVRTDDVCAAGGTEFVADVLGRTISPTSTTISTRVEEVEFYYRLDPNDNGLLDSGENSGWTSLGLVDIANPLTGTVDNNLGPWRKVIDTSALPRGHIIVKAVARDDTYTTDSVNNVKPLDVNDVTSTYNPATESLDPPQFVFGSFLNSCGTAAGALSKSISTSSPGAGETVQFTITVDNPSSQAFTLQEIRDTLPAQATFQGVVTGSSTLTPAVETVDTSTNTITWTFNNVQIPANSTRTLVFEAVAPVQAGTYSNRAFAESSVGSLLSNVVEFGVGSVRLGLTNIPYFADGDSAGEVASTADPGQALTYVVTYRNDSAINAEGVQVTVDVPQYLLDVRDITGGGVHSGGVITWTVGDLPSGDGPFQLEFTANIAGPPYPSGAPAVLDVPATLTASSPVMDPLIAVASTFVRAPRAHLNLGITTVGDKTLIDPADPAENPVEFVLTYTNSGHSAAENTLLVVEIPVGFTYVSHTGGGVLDAGVLTWQLGTLAAQGNPGNTGSVTLTLSVDGDVTPGLFVGTLSADFVEPVSDDYLLTLRPEGGEGTALCEERQVDWYLNRSTATSTQPLTISATVATPPAPFREESIRNYWNPNTTGSRYDKAFLVVRQDTAAATSMEGIIDVRLWLEKHGGGNPSDISVTVYIDGPAPQSYSTTVKLTGGGTAGYIAFDTPIDVTGAPAGSVLEIVFYHNGSNLTSFKDYRIGEAVGHSYFSHCYSVPELILDKHVDVLEAVPGDPLQYDLNFSNGASSAAPDAVLTDYLPAGLLLDGVELTLSGITTVLSPSADSTPVPGQEYRYQSGIVTVPLGDLATEAQGSVRIYATVEAEPDPEVVMFLNEAELTTSHPEALPVTDQVLTTLIRPPPAELNVTRRVDESLLIVGESATFTTEVLNSGLEEAAGVTLVEDLETSRLTAGHSSPHFELIEGSIAAEIRDVEDVLIATLDAADWSVVYDDLAGRATVSLSAVDGQPISLQAGGRLILSYQMQAGATIPDGLWEFDSHTTLDSTSFAEDEDPITTESIIVTLSGNPNLRIGMTGTLEEITLGGVTSRYIDFELCIANSGVTPALGVVLHTAIPDLTSYVAGSVEAEMATATTTLGRPTCTPAAGTPEVPVYSADNDDITLILAADLEYQSSDARILRFRVLVDSPLPDLANSITGLGVVSAVNAASKQATAVVLVEVEPDLRIIKSGPSDLPYPMAEIDISSPVTADTFQVRDPSTLSIGDWVYINGSVLQILDITDTDVLVSAAVSVNDGDFIYPVIEYVITYANQGETGADAALVSDNLPANLTYVTASPVPDLVMSGYLEWDVGDLEVGEAGSITVRARPLAAAVYQNAATIESGGFLVTTPDVTTVVGGLTVTKESGQKEVFPDENNPEFGRTSYTITIHNPLRVVDAAITVVDALPTGFTFIEMSQGDNPQRCNLAATVPGDPEITEDPGQEHVFGDHWQVLEWTCDTGDDGTGQALEDRIVLRFVAEAEWGMNEGTYDNHVLVQSDVTGVVQFQSEHSPLDDVTVSYAEGVTITGSVYQDLNLNGQKDPGEDWTNGVTVRVNLVDALERVVSTPVEVARGTGEFAFPNRPASSYTVIITDSYQAVTSKAPIGWAFVEPDNGEYELGSVSGDVSGVDLGLFLGTHLTGTVFRDDGRTTGTANNGVQDGDEPTVPGATVTISGPNGGVSVKADATGSFSAYAPAEWGATLAVTQDAGPVTGWSNGTTVSKVTSLAQAQAGNVSFNNAAGGDQVLHIGAVRESIFQGDRIGETTSPGVIEYTHHYRPGTYGTLFFNGVGTMDEAIYEIYLDQDCDGELESSERTLAIDVTVDAQWPRDADGRLSECLVQVRVLVTYGVTSGRTDFADISAVLAWEGNSVVVDQPAVQDVTMVRQRQDLMLVATVENVNNVNDAPGRVSRALPTENLEYCVYYQNIGIRAITDVYVSMPVPFHTDFQQDVYGALDKDVLWTHGGVEHTYAFEENADLGYFGRLVTADVGTLMPAEDGRICFQVKVR